MTEQVKENTLTYYYKYYLRKRVEDGSIKQEDVESHLLHFIQFFDAVKAHTLEAAGENNRNLHNFTDVGFIVLVNILSNEYDIDYKEFINLIRTFSPAKLIKNFKAIHEDEEITDSDNYVPMLMKIPSNEEELSATMANVSHHLYTQMLQNRFLSSVN